MPHLRDFRDRQSVRDEQSRIRGQWADWLRSLSHYWSAFILIGGPS
jgi:hypothetical protein